jgi:AraC-like DNA-binding protein
MRQCERKSYERLGLSPKVYSRMIRFSHAYKYKESSPHTSWTEIAHRCGYFDQMHFIRDFKAFAGFTPSMLKEAEIEKSVLFRKMEDLSISF